MNAERLVRRHLRRNYWLGVANGAIFGFAESLFAPALVLAVFVAQLGGSNFLIGLLPALFNGGWYLPQLLISHRLARLPLKRRIYDLAAVIRIACWGLIALLTPLVGAQQPALLLALFFILYTIYCLAAGLGGNSFMTVVAKTIPPARRGSFFGLRDLTGTAAGLLAGYVVSLILGANGHLPFPNDFALIFLITFIGITSGLIMFAFVIEPAEKIASEPATLTGDLRSSRTIWQTDPGFRRFLLTRILLVIADIATPFYAIYATRSLGAPDQIVGLYIAATALSAMLANPLLSRAGGKAGYHLLLVVAAGSALAMPLLAILLGRIGGAGMAIPLALVFVLYGLARTSINIAGNTLLLNIAPATQRTLYIGLANTLLGIFTAIPAFGGLLVDHLGFEALFLLAGAVAICALWLAAGLQLDRPAAAKAARSERSNP